MSDINFENIIVSYTVKQDNVPFVGQMTVSVDISKKPLFENPQSIDVLFDSSLSSIGINDSVNLGTSKISYKSIGAEDYRQRIKMTISLPQNLRDWTNPYNSARDAAKKLLPQIIAEHEKQYSRTPTE